MTKMGSKSMSSLFPNEPTNGNMLSEWLGDSDSGAVFDETRRYRYSLWRRFESGCDVSRMAIWICLNPSTANEVDNDPTVSRCIAFSKRWRYGGYVMLNAFAWRETDRFLMLKVPTPTGDRNNEAIRWFAGCGGIIIAAWGNEGRHQRRSEWLRTELREYLVHHMGLTKLGEPRHPLYLRSDTQPSLWKEI